MDEDLSEVESALYCNCLLLGYEASKTGVELSRHMFRHSNPKAGEALLHFLLSSIRPHQSQKDFLGVWPIFDARQARDFRKVVQGLLADLEASRDLPRSNSRLSSLATCCGERFIELMWHLSAHALREVLLRMTSSDTKHVPVRLTEVAQQAENATALEPVLQARIVLQRKKFLTSAAAAVERQNEWADFADEITAEHRALLVDQASLQQQLQQLQHETLTKLGSAEDVGAARLRQDTAAQRASQTWSSLIGHIEDSRSMTSGHLQDVLTQREHRYRIDGAALREAMQASRRQESEGSDASAVQSAESVRQGVKCSAEPLDVADLVQSWTGALQASQQQLQQGRPEEPLLADGEGSHGQALEAALAEHKKHLANLQGLVSALKLQTPHCESTVQQLQEQVADAMEDTAQAGTPLSEGLFTPCRKPVGSEALTGNSKAARLQLVPPTPAMKLKSRGASAESGLGPLESLEEGEGSETLGPSALREAKERTKLGSRLVGSLLEDEPSSSQSIAELRRSVHVAASEARREHVAASAPLTAGSRNQVFVTPAASLQGDKYSESSVATRRSRPGVKGRLNIENGVPRGRATGVTCPPRDLSVEVGRKYTERGRFGREQRTKDHAGASSIGDSHSSVGEVEHTSVDAPAFEHAFGRPLRESSASRQSVPGWAAERVFSPPLQVEVEQGGNDPDDIFDLLAPLKAQDLNFHNPRGKSRVEQSLPSGVG